MLIDKFSLMSKDAARYKLTIKYMQKVIKVSSLKEFTKCTNI